MTPLMIFAGLAIAHAVGIALLMFGLMAAVEYFENNP